MNKLTKAGISTAAAVALLMGGAGTLAYWNDSAGLDGAATITAGTLNVTATDNGAWAGITNIADYRIVPGDTITFTQEITVTAEGNALVANLALAPNAITAGTSAADIALADALTKSATFAVTAGGGAGVVVGTGANAGTVTFTPGTGTLSTTLDVEVTITFPAGTVAQYNDAKTGQVSLSDFSVVLTQVI
jgi:alternate signal-mediated exported protein